VTWGADRITWWSTTNGSQMNGEGWKYSVSAFLLKD
jgi:hypothetical protein